MGKEEEKLSLYPQDNGDRGVKTEEHRVSLAGNEIFQNFSGLIRKKEKDYVSHYLSSMWTSGQLLRFPPDKGSIIVELHHLE